MSQNFIIVKYPEFYKDRKAHVTDTCAYSFSAKECGIDQSIYSTREEATPDLKKIQEFNPGVEYGIVEVE